MVHRHEGNQTFKAFQSYPVPRSSDCDSERPGHGIFSSTRRDRIAGYWELEGGESSNERNVLIRTSGNSIRRGTPPSMLDHRCGVTTKRNQLSLSSRRASGAMILKRCCTGFILSRRASIAIWSLHKLMRVRRQESWAFYEYSTESSPRFLE